MLLDISCFFYNPKHSDFFCGADFYWGVPYSFLLSLRSHIVVVIFYVDLDKRKTSFEQLSNDIE